MLSVTSNVLANIVLIWLALCVLVFILWWLAIEVLQKINRRKERERKNIFTKEATPKRRD